MLREQPSFCRICAAACGIIVSVDGDRVDRVRGDLVHPVSHGYTCSKGRSLPEWHHSTARLDRPRLRDAETSWDSLLGDLAGALGRITDQSGADAIGLYLATGLAYDAAGQVAASQWLPAIGSRSFFTAVTVDNAPVLVAAELVTGQPMLNPVWDPEQPGLLLLVGTNPVVSHGYGTAFADPIRRIRDYRRRGGEVWVLDPRRTETAAIADEHVPIRPGADIAVLGAIARALLADGVEPTELATHAEPSAVARLRAALAPFTSVRAADEAGVDQAVIVRLIDAVRSHPGRVAVMCGTGVTMSHDGVVAEWLRWVVLIMSGSLDRAGGMRFNCGAINRLRPPSPGAPAANRPSTPGAASRPELPRVLGQLPAVAIADEIEAGNLRALLITGGNPIMACPEPDRMRSALAALDVLAVVDVSENELTQLATHVLPATGQLERADLTLAELTAVRSGLQATAAVVPPHAERKPVWWMLASLALRMGADLVRGVDPDDLTDEQFLSGLLARAPFAAADVFDAGPHGIDVPHEYGWVRAELLAGGRWNIAPTEMLERLRECAGPENGAVLVPRREMGWSNSVRYGGPGLEP
ncbi:MAG: molybdopterin-dependent oxidoreductase, partial [Acidimicrobiia bacterium]